MNESFIYLSINNLPIKFSTSSVMIIFKWIDNAQLTNANIIDLSVLQNIDTINNYSSQFVTIIYSYFLSYFELFQLSYLQND